MVSRLPFYFLITGLICFALFQIGSLSDFSAWLYEFSMEPRYPTGWAKAHLHVLGWATMIAMGAVYQLVPVVLQNHKLFSERLGYIQYGVFTLGFAGLVIGLQQMNVVMVGSFAAIAFLGILLFAWNIGITLFRSRLWNNVTISCAMAVGHLVLTGVIGMLMGLNFAFEWWGTFHDQLLGAHLWFGAIGWFGFLITGFSYKLFPMFYLSHGHPEALQRWVMGFLFAGVWMGVISFLLNAPAWSHWIGLLCTATAFSLYVYHLGQICKSRHKANPGAGIRWSWLLAQGIAAIAVLLVILSAVLPDLILSTRMTAVIGWLYLWGWVGMTIMAYLSKIIPFLWWTYRYGSRVGQAKIPTMADLIDDRKVNILLTAVAASLFILLIGFGWNLPLILSIGGSLLAVSALVYVGLLAAVFTK